MGCIIIILSFFHVIFYYRHYLFKALSAYAFDVTEPNFKLGNIPCIPLLAEQPGVLQEADAPLLCSASGGLSHRRGQQADIVD